MYFGPTPGYPAGTEDWTMSAPGKAYSYIRFSTPEQAQGDSLRRQTSMAAEYCTRHGLTLDTELTMQDLGVSAYRGKNLDGTGKLGVFLDAVKAGDVAHGAVLLLESLDRLTRQSARKAVAILGDIVDLGIDVVTLNDGKRYSKSSFDDIELVIAVLLMSRAHNESREKGRRVADAWAAKRAGKAGQGYGRTANVLTKIVPGWIRVEDGKCKLIPERAKIVRRVFALFMAGHGQHAIAKTLEGEKVPRFGRSKHWHQSYIAKILRTPAVIGTMTPHTDDSTTRTPQTPIEGYYPAVIDRELWNRAQALIETHAKSPGATSSRLVQNILSGLAKCPHCGGAMTRVFKGRGPKGGVPKLVCAWAKTGGVCQYVSVSLPAIENALQRTARDPVPKADSTVRDELANRHGELEGLEGVIEDLVAAVEHSASKALLARLKAREEQRDRLSEELAVLEKKAEGSDTKLFKRRLERYRAVMAAKPFDVGAANVALREMVSKVIVDHDHGTLRMHWRHDGETEIVYDGVKYGGLVPVK